jgi:hypothetical protein
MAEVLQILDTITQADIATHDELCAGYDQELKVEWDLEKERERKEREGLNASAKVGKKSKRDVMTDEKLESPRASPTVSTSPSLTGSNPSVPTGSGGTSPVTPMRPGTSVPNQAPVRPDRTPTLEKSDPSAKPRTQGRYISMTLCYFLSFIH